MATVPIYQLTGSINVANRPIIRVNALNDSGLASPSARILQFFRDGLSVFTINSDGSINSSGSLNINGAGVKLPASTATNALSYYDGTKIVGQPFITYTNPSIGVYRLNNTGSNYAQNIIEGKSTNGSFAEGSIYVGVDNNKRARFPNNADLQSIGPERMGIRILNSGSAYFTFHPSSSNFINSTRSQRSAIANSQQNFHNVLQIQDNTFYFWPTQYAASTIGRGGALGIGVLPGPIISSSACQAALHINVFSASVAGIGAGNWTGTATGVKNRQAAIVVTYGSGSNNSPFINNFYVSSSGNVYNRGWMLVDGQTNTAPNANKALKVNGDAQVTGTLTKGGGSFLITHPDPIKAAEGYKLRHCFVESPTRGDNLYRYQITTTQNNLSVTIPLPDYWQYLNENPQVWISPIDCFGIGYGTVNQSLTEINVITNVAGTYNVLLVGTRKDQLMKDYFDADGVEFIDDQNLPT